MTNRRVSSTADLVNSLNLIPYFTARPGASIFQAARDLGRKPQEIMQDLNRLFCCGRPGLMPDDLVDMHHNYKEVYINRAQGMDRALRLTNTEAAVLLLSLESLENYPGLTDAKAVRSAAEKLRRVVNTPIATATVADATPDAGGDPAEQLLTVLRNAIETKHMVHFTYTSDSSDTATKRSVRPLRVFTNGGYTYFHGLNLRGQQRSFRLDRVTGLNMGEKATVEPEQATTFNVDDPFGFKRVRKLATLWLRPDATWMADYMALTLKGETSDGTQAPMGWHKATMPFGSEEWLARFVLSNSDRMVVSDPYECAELVRQRAVSGLAAYDEG